MAEAEELAKMVDIGELSRDFGLDITVSDGGLVTSALNQRQYRAECGKLYQQFMLSMADYIFEETQLKKRFQVGYGFSARQCLLHSINTHGS